MDGALFSLLFFFFVQIAAGVAPLRWPECKWLASVTFWISTAGAAICLIWYGYSQDWVSMAIEMMGQRTFGILALIIGTAIGIFGLSIIASGDKPKTASLTKSDIFLLGQNIYCESRSVNATDGRETNLYENSFYLVVGNQSKEGKTLKRVQARIQGYEAPTLAGIKDATAGEIDIRHGEWAFFMIGRIVSSQYLGLYKGAITLDGNSLKRYEHNVPIGALSFEVLSFDTKRQYGLGHRPEHPQVWSVPVVISADDQKSLTVVLDVDFNNQKTPVTYHEGG